MINVSPSHAAELPGAYFPPEYFSNPLYHVCGGGGRQYMVLPIQARVITVFGLCITITPTARPHIGSETELFRMVLCKQFS